MSNLLRLLSLLIFLTAAALASVDAGWGAEPEEKKSEENNPGEESVEAGHSYHGEAFNEGPRQKAYLMEGMGHVDFPVTTKSEEAQKFVTQGLGQLYGFWYLEAERSFRQAAALDPDCAMAYWGAALANSRNTKRAKGFMEEAMKRRDKVSQREQMYLDAFNKYVNADPKKRKERAEAYVADLEKLLLEHPDDIEAKALLGLQLYLNRSQGSKIVSYFAVDALLGEVFQKQPLHSAHHFRIHLWDAKKPERALESAALCGKGTPGIAHMWHMPGHIYSRLKRYNEAVWQQEASARVDHAHMMRDRVLPDEIHNFAHNNEWLIRNLMYVGRVEDALSLAKNMLELPRHPKYNTPKRGSANYGRRRLLEVLRRYELWDEALGLADSDYLKGDLLPGAPIRSRMETLGLLGAASFQVGGEENLAAGEKTLADIRSELDEKRQHREQAALEAKRKYYREHAKPWALTADKEPLPPWETTPEPLNKKQEKARDKVVADAKKKFDGDIRELEKTERYVDGWKHVALGEFEAAYDLLRRAGGVDTHLLTAIQFAAGEQDKALESLKSYVDRHRNEVLPLGVYTELLWKAGKKDEAQKQMETMRSVAATMDLDTPLAKRLQPIAEALKLTDANGDWRLPFKYGDDFGSRPDLAELGPFRWRPSPAPSWQLPGVNGTQRSLADYQDRPVIVIFYLGYGCLHCVEQLQKFSPMKEQFAELGIDLVAISSDDIEGLEIGIRDFKPGKLDIPLVADPELKVFKKYRAYDDFESQPLHGTFLIDPSGQVLWQDISYEPFMDAEFLLKEAPRLLNLQQAPPSASTPAGVAGE